MKTIREIRVENLAALINEAGGNKAFALIIGKSDAQVSQWLNTSKDSKTGKPRGMSDDIARDIEKACDKEIGWMDNDHSDNGAELFMRLPKEVRTWLLRQASKADEPKGNGTK